MAIPSASTLKLSILIIILLAFEARETIAIGARVRVTIENNVRAPNPTTMTVHCKSKDDDLGYHTVIFGQSYMFSFKPIVFPIKVATLFFCSFTWPQDPSLHYLDVYDENKDTCRNCSWTINVDGGCLNGECRSFKKKYPINGCKSLAL
jgi:hypothetical protein